MSKSTLERDFAFQLWAAGIRDFEREYRFAEGRRFRFDFAWPARRNKVAVEIEGGLNRPNSGHRSFWGTRRDIVKSQLAVSLGWKLLRLTPEDVRSGTGLRLLAGLLKEN